MTRPRVQMRLHLTQQETNPAIAARTVTSADADALASLMWHAYHGTIDDEGETPADAAREIGILFAGGYGPLLTDCSFIAEAGGEVVAATLVTFFARERVPLLAFAMTHPAHANRGLAGDLIRRSINALIADGYTGLCLFVTEGNAPAQHLYAKLGFQAWPVTA